MELRLNFDSVSTDVSRLILETAGNILNKRIYKPGVDISDPVLDLTIAFSLIQRIASGRVDSNAAIHSKEEAVGQKEEAFRWACDFLNRQVALRAE